MATPTGEAPDVGNPRNPKVKVRESGLEAGATQCELPFLGKVAASSGEELVRWRDAKGRNSILSMKMYYTEDGRWFRGEYARPGSQNEARAVEYVQRQLERLGQRYTGIPIKAAPLPLGEILAKLEQEVEFNEATRFDINYLMVTVEGDDKPARACIVFNVWGVRTFPLHHPGDDTKRVRIVYDIDTGWFQENDIL